MLTFINCIKFSQNNEFHLRASSSARRWTLFDDNFVSIHSTHCHTVSSVNLTIHQCVTIFTNYALQIWSPRGAVAQTRMIIIYKNCAFCETAAWGFAARVSPCNSANKNIKISDTLDTFHFVVKRFFKRGHATCHMFVKVFTNFSLQLWIEVSWSYAMIKDTHLQTLVIACAATMGFCAGESACNPANRQMSQCNISLVCESFHKLCVSNVGQIFVMLHNTSRSRFTQVAHSVCVHYGYCS